MAYVTPRGAIAVLMLILTVFAVPAAAQQAPAPEAAGAPAGPSAAVDDDGARPIDLFEIYEQRRIKLADDDAAGPSQSTPASAPSVPS